MISQITDYGGYGYEIHKNGLFWDTYIYKKEPEFNYKLVNIIRFLVKPKSEMIHATIDRTVADIGVDNSLSTHHVACKY